MTREIHSFESITSCNNGNVIFGNGNMGSIQGRGNLYRNESPKLENVFLVKGLVSNLISISQFCDKGLEVRFIKTECYVTNQEGKVLLRGVRSKNNNYKWVPSHLDQTTMLSKKLEHQDTHEHHSTNNGRSLCLKVNHINRSTEDTLKRKVTFILGKCTIIFGKMKQLKDKLDISLEKMLWQLIYDKHAKTSLVSLLSFVHTKSRSFSHLLTQLLT